MHIEAHAALGWLIGNAAGGNSRRVRNWCVAAAVLPDVDAIAFVRERTPLDMFSPKLDALIISCFQKKPLRCAVCSQAGNRHCENCGQPLCARHMRISRRVDVRCPDCATHAAAIRR